MRCELLVRWVPPIRTIWIVCVLLDKLRVVARPTICRVPLHHRERSPAPSCCALSPVQDTEVLPGLTPQGLAPRRLAFNVGPKFNGSRHARPFLAGPQLYHQILAWP